MAHFASQDEPDIQPPFSGLTQHFEGQYESTNDKRMTSQDGGNHITPKKQSNTSKSNKKQHHGWKGNSKNNNESPRSTRRRGGDPFNNQSQKSIATVIPRNQIHFE